MTYCKNIQLQRIVIFHTPVYCRALLSLILGGVCHTAHETIPDKHWIFDTKIKGTPYFLCNFFTHLIASERSCSANTLLQTKKVKNYTLFQLKASKMIIAVTIGVTPVPSPFQEAKHYEYGCSYQGCVSICLNVKLILAPRALFRTGSE